MATWREERRSVSPRFWNCLVLMWAISIVFVGNSVDRPNVLFIALDDLNDWIGPMRGHPQAKTPNLDRLAASGVFFDNAHCPAPAWNPSRTAIFTGLSSHHIGMYTNGQKMREVHPDAELLPKYFPRHGYWSGGSGNDSIKIAEWLKEKPS